ncbi:MAG: hypothetical protein RL757_541 [Bacteroidota bacterium]|jgi:aquaporin Z
MKKYLVEFIGTFFLTLVICSMKLGSVDTNMPAAIGMTLAAMIYAGGYISGAHYNPAVTIAVWLRGKCSTQDVPFYIGAQLAAATLAAISASFIVGKLPQSVAMDTPMPALIGEILGTFALVWVILNVATAKTVEGNNYYGIAIGFTVMGMAYALGQTFNPAVGLAVSIATKSFGGLWISALGSIVGGVLAAFTFRFINPEE